MALSTQELERLADDLYRQRHIMGSVYCGECGYNLRTLPYVYTCPECGSEYNARPLTMKGIFTPHEVDLPVGDFTAAVFCASATWLLGNDALKPLYPGRLAIAAVFAVPAILFARQTYGRLHRYLKVRSIARRIAREEEE